MSAPLKVLAAVIAHPLRKVSGATNAGVQLSIATAELVDMELAVMWDADEALTIGRLPIRRMRCTHPWAGSAAWLPRGAVIPFYGSRIPDLIRAGSYDLVHIHNLFPLAAASQVARACLARGVPYVISSHGFNELNRYARINDYGFWGSLLADVAVTRPFRRIVRNASAILALSDREHDLLAGLGVGADRIWVVSNGVNEFYLQPPALHELNAAREKFIGGRGPVLLYMGSIHRYKGLDVFLRSLHGVTGPFQAVVAGAFKDDEHRRAIVRDAGFAGGAPPPVVFTGAISDAELRALYHLADLFVYPTRADTLPLVVLEAMACGLPVVSTTVGGIPFMVGPEHGSLVPPDDPEAVSVAVNALLDDPDRRRLMGAHAQETVRERFRWSAAARCAADSYTELLAMLHPTMPVAGPAAGPLAGSASRRAPGLRP